MFERLQRLHGPEAALCLDPRRVRLESLTLELLRAELDMQRDFRADITLVDVATTKHEVEEPADAGPDEWHD